MPAKAHARIMHKNPNPRGACLCSPTQKASGCDGPFLVFTHSEMQDPRQPNPVLSLSCAEKFFAKARKPEPAAEPARVPPVPQALLDAIDLANQAHAAVQAARADAAPEAA